MEGKNLDKFIVGIIIVGITLVLGIYIAATMQNTFRTPNTTGAAVNESVTSSPASGLSATLAAGAYVDGTCGAITAAYNGTNGIPFVLVGNFTQTGCAVVNATDFTDYGTALLFSYPYTYSADTVSSNGAGTLVSALNGGTAWITIIVVVGFAVIVLGMLTNGLGKAGQSNTYEQAGPVY